MYVVEAGCGSTTGTRLRVFSMGINRPAPASSSLGQAQIEEVFLCFFFGSTELWRDSNLVIYRDDAYISHVMIYLVYI